MASADKTEKPTPRKLLRAREQGQVAKSQDLNGAVVLGTATALFAFSGAYAYSTLFGFCQEIFSTLSSKPITLSEFFSLWQDLLTVIFLLLAPFALTVMVMGIVINIAQVKPLFTMKPLQPKLDKLNPVNGVKRLFSMRSIIETLKSIFKMVLVAICGIILIQIHQQELLILSSASVAGGVFTILNIIGEIAFATTLIFLLLGAIDWRYQKYELEKKLRMSKQEVKDERKDLEGDAQMKSRIRQAGMQFARKRQLADVPTADVIVTNPTHYSIAIKYDPDLYPAPHVVAKGVDHFALKIREVAKEHNVPLVENKPLARSLYGSVDAGEMIPPELFVTVAEVLAYVFSKNKGRKKNLKKPT